MREIKFRAFPHLDSDFPKKMIYFDFDDFQVEGYSDTVSVKDYATHQFEYLHIMQYTGLKDKNGVEICEGDIVKVIPILNGHKGSERICEVTYEKPIAAFMVGKRLFMNDIGELEVIGNIYEK